MRIIFFSADGFWTRKIKAHVDGLVDIDIDIDIDLHVFSGVRGRVGA